MVSYQKMYRIDQVFFWATPTTGLAGQDQGDRTFSCPPAPWPLLQTIPPERVGLNGKYDHLGLAKRAKRALSQSFQTAEIAGLSLSQRGRVLVLEGWVANQSLLNKLINTLMQVNGVEAVETRQVVVTNAPVITTFLKALTVEYQNALPIRQLH